MHKPVATQGTLAELRNVGPDVQEVKVEQGLDQAMQHYRRFLEESPETAMTPEAMRRLADLELEKQFGIHTGDGKPREMAAPESAQALADAPARTPNPAAAAAGAGHAGIRSGFRAAHDCGEPDPGKRRHGASPTECQALTQLPRVRSRRSLSIIGCSPSTPVTRTATRSSIRWRERTTNSVAPMRPWKPWSA